MKAVSPSGTITDMNKHNSIYNFINQSFIIMRKHLLFLLVAILTPVLSFGQEFNRSLTFKDRTNFYTQTEDVVGVAMDVIEPGTTPASFTNHSFTIGAWMRISQLPSYSVANYQFADAWLMGYRGLNHANSNGCIGICLKRSDASLYLAGFGWGDIKATAIPVTINTGEWHFIAISVDEENMMARVFVDDEMVLEKAMAKSHGSFDDTPAAFSFGGFGTMGALDDSFVFDRALQLDDIKKVVAGRAANVEGLKGWYTFDEVKEGTTSAFANNVEGNDVDAIYYSAKGTAQETGIVNCALSNSEPDLTTITAETARVLPVLEAKFAVPSATDFENIEELTFTANGETLAAGEEATLIVGTEVTINVTPATGYQISEISIDGTIIENGGSFAIENELSKENIVIKTAANAYALTVVNENEVPYTLTTATNGEVDLTNILEGTSLHLTLNVAFDYVISSVTLGEETLTANEDGIYVFDMPSADATLTINAEKKTTYAVSIVNRGGGTLTVSCDGKELTDGDRLIPGQIVTISATADSDHMLQGVYVNDTQLSGVTFTMPEEDVTVKAIFAEKAEWNRSITFIDNTSASTTTEDIVAVDHSILPGVSTQSDLAKRSVSLGAWVRLTKRGGTISNGGNVILMYGGLNHCNANGLMTVTTTNQGRMYLGGFGMNTLLGSNLNDLGMTIKLNEWHYVAVAVDFESRQVRFYFDGERKKTFDFKAGVNAYGSWNDTPWGFGFGQLTCNGAMDDIHIVDGAISDDDALMLYNNNAELVNNLVGWYTFDEEKAGTTGHFSNMISERSAYDAVYYKLTGTNTLWGGLTDVEREEAAPDLETVTPEIQRPVAAKTLENDRTVTVASANDDLGTVSIVTPQTDDLTVTTNAMRVTVTATPAAGVSFINWTNEEGEEVSKEATYIYDGETDINLTANFGYMINYTVGEGGSAVVKVNGTSIAPGSIFTPGSEVEVTVTPNSGKAFILNVNGNDIALEDNVYTTTLESLLDIKVNFTDRVNHYYELVSGNGTVECWSAYDESDPDLPAGIKYENGDILPAIFDEDGNMNTLNFWFRPEEGSALISVIWTMGEDAHELFYDETGSEQFGYYDPFDEDLINAGVKVWWTSEELNNDCTMTVVFGDEAQGIDKIGLDAANGPVEYYNLQGIRVAAENLTSGFYIARQGEKAVKVFIVK